MAKLGTNTLVLSGANTYSGATNVYGGTLKITGSHNGGSIYSIAPVAGNVADVVVGSGASVATTQQMTVGFAGTGTLTQNGGSVASGTWITLGEQTTSSGTYNLVSGSVSTGNVSAQNLVLGFQGVGNFNQTAGDVSVNGALVVGWTSTAVGDYEMASGTVSVTGPIQLGIDQGSLGTFTFNDGAITCNDWVVTGTFGGDGHFFQHGGSINTVNFVVAQQDTSTGDYHMDETNSSASITTSGFFAVGFGGQGTFEMDGGSISATGPVQLGVYDYGNGTVSDGTFTMNGGSITCNDWVVTGTFGGDGHFFHHHGTIDTVNFDVAQGIVNGDYHMDGADASITTTGFFAVGDGGIGTFDLVDGQINVGSGVNGVVYVGWGATGNGTLHQTGGSIVSGDQTYIGVDGIGEYDLDAGTYSVGDNLWIGLNTIGSGTVNMTGGTLTVVGNDPSYTGNVLVGDHGSGTLTMTAGTLDMIEGDTGTNNSISYSVAQADPEFGPGWKPADWRGRRHWGCRYLRHGGGQRRRQCRCRRC